MKQNISTPTAILIAVVCLVCFGFILWKRYLSSPQTNDQPFAPTMARPATPPHTREEGLKMYSGSH